MAMIGADRGWSRGVILALACTVLVFLMAPMLVVFPVSVTDQRFLAFPQEEISFSHYRTVLATGNWMHAIWQSLAIALAATAIDVVVGTLCAIGCWRLASRTSELVRTLGLAIAWPLGQYLGGLFAARHWRPLRWKRV